MSQFAWFSFFVQFLFAQVSKIWNLTTTACIVQFYICSTTRVIFCSDFLQKFCNFPCDFPPHVTIGSPSHQDYKSWQVPSLCLCQSITNHFQAFSLKYPFFYWSYDFHHFQLHFGCVWQSRGFQYTGGCGDGCCGGLLGAYLLGRRIQKARIIRRQHSWSSGHLNVCVFRWRIQIREGAAFVVLVCLVPNEIPLGLGFFFSKISRTVKFWCMLLGFLSLKFISRTSTTIF